MTNTAKLGDQKRGQCDICGKTKKVTWTYDPYEVELYRDEELEANWWCDDCNEESFREV